MIYRIGFLLIQVQLLIFWAPKQMNLLFIIHQKLFYLNRTNRFTICRICLEKTKLIYNTRKKERSQSRLCYLERHAAPVDNVWNATSFTSYALKTCAIPDKKNMLFNHFRVMFYVTQKLRKRDLRAIVKFTSKQLCCSL